MQAIPLTDAEFAKVCVLAQQALGIHLPASKRALVIGRWTKRLAQRGVKSFHDYLELIRKPTEAGELQAALDLLTTNETHFFRERQHFDFLAKKVLPEHKAGVFRVWSAASSSGEEPYSIAMLLASELRAGSWEVVGSDICTRVLEKARAAHYEMERARTIPTEYLRKFCLRGTGPHNGTFLIDRPVRERVQYKQVNLNQPLPAMGTFDVIFLRNVMIYFQLPTKAAVVKRLLPALKPGGHFIIGHCETLNGIEHGLDLISASIYRKPIT